jgi:hypothetical protein
MGIPEVTIAGRRVQTLKKMSRPHQRSRVALELRTGIEGRQNAGIMQAGEIVPAVSSDLTARGFY